MADPTYGPDGTFNNWKGLSFVNPSLAELDASKLQDKTQWPTETSRNILEASSQSHVLSKEVGSMGLGHRY